MALPSLAEQTDLLARARACASADQVDVVWALAEFMRIVGPFVRAEKSGPAMIDAFKLGLTALRAVVDHSEKPA